MCVCLCVWSRARTVCFNIDWEIKLNALTNTDTAHQLIPGNWWLRVNREEKLYVKQNIVNRPEDKEVKLNAQCNIYVCARVCPCRGYMNVQSNWWNPSLLSLLMQSDQENEIKKKKLQNPVLHAFSIFLILFFAFVFSSCFVVFAVVVQTTRNILFGAIFKQLNISRQLMGLSCTIIWLCRNDRCSRLHINIFVRLEGSSGAHFELNVWWSWWW